MQKNYYDILEIGQNATEQEIKKAYRRLAKLYHPDVNKKPHAHEKFIEITEAYEFLIRNGQTAEYTNTSSDGKKYWEQEEYINFREEVRKKAEEQARMRYEAFKKQNEAFQKSGLSDIGLLFTMIFRVLAIPLILALFLLPIALAIGVGDYKLLSLCLLTWVFGGVLGWYIYDNRKHYFIPGKFYYNLSRIIQIFSDTRPTNQKCFYCPSKTANSKPYKIELLKLKDIKLKFNGPRQHSMNYINEKAVISVPRSQKAFIVHTVTVCVKIFSIFGCLVFFNITSFAWRFILGLLLGGVISTFILLITNTRSNVTYLWSFGLILRVCCWLIPIVLCSALTFQPFNIIGSDYMHFIITAIVLFDCVLMQLVNLIIGKYSYTPIIRQYKEADQYFKLGYKVYNDVFVISVVYPIFRWIFG